MCISRKSRSCSRKPVCHPQAGNHCRRQYVWDNVICRKTKSDDQAIHGEDSALGTEKVKPVWNKSLGPAARRQGRTLSLRCHRSWGKDKVMENGNASPLAPARPSAAPQVIFANWREMLHLLKLGRGLKYTYIQAIEGYLDYCLRNGLPVGVESARGFVADALRRGLTPDAPTWKEALNWFFHEGHERCASQPEGVPSLGQADTGKTPWESRLIERLRLQHYSWRTEQTYREWAWRLAHFVGARGLQKQVRMPCKGANQQLNRGTMRLRCMSTLKIAAERRCTTACGPYLSPG